MGLCVLEPAVPRCLTSMAGMELAPSHATELPCAAITAES